LKTTLYVNVNINRTS